MKTLKLIGLVVLMVCAVGAVVGGVIFFANHQTSPDTAVTTCPSGQHPNYTIIIKSDKMQPEDTKASYCGTLTITNEDNVNRLIAFGTHDHHRAYDGVTEVLLSKGQSVKVDLVKRGNFRVHDHLHDEVQGTFSVQ